MSKKILIDASHLEETRVVSLQDNVLEEFDFESEHKKQLKSNIYLARITRVEPSLQAAFVEYGENRQGFLAFSEIHPDYYQIPLADRKELLQAQEEEARQQQLQEEEKLAAAGNVKKNRKRKSKAENVKEDKEFIELDANGNFIPEAEPITIFETDDPLELEISEKKIAIKNYKIQDVIKRRQIILVQVTKEERGNKGAALTTYLSLAGRYSVLMPNTARGGGISRKITNITERQHLKKIVQTLDIPEGMGIILRTAGAKRSKLEIKKDYEYLMRLWNDIKQRVFKSIAPSLVHEEGNLIKRSIRDLYTKDVTEILVSGDDAYKEAKNFMRMLMPSQSKYIQPYKGSVPIFSYYGVESQLNQIFQPHVNLKSGGYLIINQTEALVSIDVNSGRSTKETSVEDTALQTNLEAAEAVAKQLKLRDLAGLIVIDFIDMTEKNHIRAVEKLLRDCLKEDRARIQIGHISPFGLLEMSRQRLRASILENITQPCPHCQGAGYIKSDSSVALNLLRSIEEFALNNLGYNINVTTSEVTALYIFNNKRLILCDIEKRFAISVNIQIDAHMNGSFILTKGEATDKMPVIEVSLPKAVTESEVKKVVEETTINKTSKIDEKTSKTEEKDIKVSNKIVPQSKKQRGKKPLRTAYVPYAEPVGPFALVAYAELRAKRMRRRLWGYKIPSPEFVNLEVELPENFKFVSNKVRFEKKLIKKKNFNKKNHNNNKDLAQTADDKATNNRSLKHKKNKKNIIKENNDISSNEHKNLDNNIVSIEPFEQVNSELAHNIDVALDLLKNEESTGSTKKKRLGWWQRRRK
ncbi:ribonuclease E/G [Bartonella sp. DGB1]|uniref:Rne/Rng family ribonuclease n=1 Tax=Bartonella sp. DGB1 TaxID=3239807 RepID=UPI003525EE8F